MIITKILNNNVIISVNEKREEIIVIGCGIAFKKKVGDIVEESLVEKIFISEDTKTKRQIEIILEEIPLKYIKITDKIIKFTEEKFSKKIKDYIYISIADHIYRAIERFVNQGELVNGLLWDIKKLYAEEFKIGLYALNIIEEETKIKMPEDEAAFIAMHIVNARINESIPTIIDLTKLVNEMTNIIKYNLFIDINENLLSYCRFINHLKFLGQKILNNRIGDNSSDNDELFILISEKYPKEKECADKISEFLYKKYKYNIQIDELLFLIIHIVKIKDEIEKKLT